MIVAIQLILVSVWASADGTGAATLNKLFSPGIAKKVEVLPAGLKPSEMRRLHWEPVKGHTFGEDCATPMELSTEETKSQRVFGCLQAMSVGPRFWSYRTDSPNGFIYYSEFTRNTLIKQKIYHGGRLVLTRYAVAEYKDFILFDVIKETTKGTTSSIYTKQRDDGTYYFEYSGFYDRALPKSLQGRENKFIRSVDSMVIFKEIQSASN